MDKFVLLAILACSTISVVLAKDQETAFLEDIKRDARIVGGSLAAPNQFPHMAFLRVVNKTGAWFICGGALISTRWVLTAAHCLRNRVSVNVHLGSVYKYKPLILIKNITNFSIHEDTDTEKGDIAVINLGRDVPISASVKPIRLPRKSQATELFVNKVATVAGWGKTLNVPPFPKVLYFVQLKVITNQRCRQHYAQQYIRATIICAIGNETTAQGTCGGDSGGPFLLREADGLDTHIGVMNFGSAKGCNASYPTGFARTSSYIDWISKKTGIPVRP